MGQQGDDLASMTYGPSEGNLGTQRGGVEGRLLDPAVPQLSLAFSGVGFVGLATGMQICDFVPRGRRS